PIPLLAPMMRTVATASCSTIELALAHHHVQCRQPHRKIGERLEREISRRSPMSVLRAKEGLKSCSACRTVCAIVGNSTGGGRQRPTSIQNDSGLSQGPAGASGASWARGKLAQRGPGGEPMLDTTRREFIALIGGGCLLLAVKVKRAWGQQPAMPVVGFLSGRSPSESAYALAAFHQGLKQGGYVEGQNVAIEYRWAEGQY